MSSYAKTVNFAVKDGLASGDPSKVVKGTELDTEFNNIATMSATKQDSLPISDSSTIVFNASDATKLLKFSLTGLTTGATRTLTIQDVSGTIAILSQPATFTTLAGTTSVVTPIVDSGASSALALKTNNGTTQVLIAHVASAVNFLSLQGGTAGNGINILSSATSSDSNVGIDFGTKGTGVYNFYTRSDVASKKQFAILDAAGADRNITVTGSNGGNPTISTTAGALSLGNGQLQFPATQNPSADVNTLDDYKEGTWTPSVGGTATYTTQVGTYTKIGRLVCVRATIVINSIGTGSTTSISGLPFVPAVQVPSSAVRANTSATAVVSVVGSINTDSTIGLVSRTAANASDSVNAIFQNSTTVQLAGYYEV